MEARVHPSLYPNCHHQIIFVKLNLTIFYSPPYMREIWYYQRANTGRIRRAINEFPWDSLLAIKNLNEKGLLFNKINEDIPICCEYFY